MSYQYYHKSIPEWKLTNYSEALLKFASFFNLKPLPLTELEFHNRRSAEILF